MSLGGKIMCVCVCVCVCVVYACTWPHIYGDIQTAHMCACIYKGARHAAAQGVKKGGT